VQNNPALVHWRFCQKKSEFPENSDNALFDWSTTCAPTQSLSDPKKGQVDVFPLVFVSADNINISALLNTDLFMKIWVGQLHAAEPKAAYDSKINPTE